MARHHYGDLLALIAVARERNFTRAAAQLEMSQSMLSSRIRALESRLGVRLLTRTTRSVAVTEAGQQLLAVVTPRLAAIENELQRVVSLNDAPAGRVRISAPDHAIDTLLWPRLAPLLQAYPRLHLELSDNQAHAEGVRERCDVEVRLGKGPDLAPLALRIGPDLGFALVAAPGYLVRCPAPTSPDDLLQHQCIALRLDAAGGQPWELQRGGHERSVRVPNRLVFNGVYPVLRAALSGHGLAYLPEDLVQPHLASGHLLPVLQDWWRTFPGYHLILAHQPDTSRALQIVVDALRYQD